MQPGRTDRLTIRPSPDFRSSFDKPNSGESGYTTIHANEAACEGNR